MAGERITGIISEAELRKNDVGQLDGIIPLLNRQLLYGNLSQEDEITGYRFLKGLVSHPDEKVQNAAADALDMRWKKVGFYELHTPYKRIPSFSENDRTYFHEAGWSGSGSGVEEECKVALLELAHNREPLTTKQFKDVMIPLLGVHADFPKIVEKLKELYILTDKAQYVPIIDSIQAQVRLSDSAYDVIAPHLPVLQAISYPEQKIAQEDKQMALSVGQEINKILAREDAFWTEENTQGLLMPSERQFFLPHIGMLDFRLEEKEKEIGKRHAGDIISFIAEQELLYVFNHINNPDSDWIQKGVEVTIYPIREDQKQLLINFWGQQIGVGRIEAGKLGVYKNKKGADYMEVSGVLIPVLLEDFRKASSVRISTEGMSVSWDDVSGRGKEVNLTISYQKSQTRLAPKMYQHRETFISDMPDKITVSASSDHKHPRIRKKKGEIEGIDLTFPRLPSYKEISIVKDEDLVEVRHPKGRYTVGYKKLGSGIEITFTGKGWNRTLTIPAKVDPVEIVRAMGQQLDVVLQRVIDEREVVAQQVAGIKHLGLVEQFYYNHLGILTTRPTDILFKDKSYYKKLVQIDKGLAVLDEDTRYYAKYYMAVLREMRKDRPIQEKVAKESNRTVNDPRVEFRNLIKKHSINIPEKLLILAEEVFMPEEYRNPPN